MDRELPTDGVVATELPPVSGRSVLWLAVLTLLLFAGLFVLGWIPRRSTLARVNADSAALVDAKPVVEIIGARASQQARTLTLPGEVRANQATALFARASGFLKPLPPGIDIGARVTAGQLLAEISAPELDADLERARAALAQTTAALARARDELAFQRASFDRYQGFAATGGLTTQQLEERKQQLAVATSGFAAAEADAAVATANEKRLRELQAFERITAPFDGVITARNYDTGAMVSATDTAANKELFRIEQADVLRVSVSVPQNLSADIGVGQPAALLVRTHPGKAFPGKVARSANSIDPLSRTLRVEVDVENRDGVLLPGSWAQVRFDLAHTRTTLLVPAAALVYGAEGVRVAVLDGTRVRFKTVVVERDLGSEVELASGLDGTEKIVGNPGLKLAEGTEVEIRAPKEKPR